ncbi:hypothetical protein LSTR_LSTR006216 [Laodelphax striatellus]|uniref:NADH dehydrogenase [ubiquinone] 1 subunit C2 n=1 Tax=Laodelphax striatellus TaxID=195883 RepID=A0A482XS21_LAOST|nr:hypothetical protein LSTR_LSTR006216 [Laodelphax striatellus]
MAAIDDPKTLLISDGSTISLLDKVTGPLSFGFIFGFGSVCYDFFKNKPLSAGFLKHVAFIAGGAYAGQFLYERKQRYHMDRDAAYRHYIDLHPEDFPAAKRVLLKDMLKPWVPCR